jgi:V8-like Glu-specific endopeptidase
MALVATGTATAAGKGAPAAEPVIVETFSEPFRGGTDPLTLQSEMNQLSSWLWAEAAATPVDPGISVDITRQDRIDIGEEPCADCDGRLLVSPGKLRVGVVKGLKQPVAFRNFSPGALRGNLLFARGGVRPAEDGAVWTLTARSAGASGLRVHFSGFDLPEGAEVYIYNDGGEAYGPYTARGPHGDGQFWSHSVGGSTANIQMRYFGELDPAKMAKVRFGINKVAHLGSHSVIPIGDEPDDPGTVTTDSFCSFNANCVQNASCSSIPGAVSVAEDAIAHMQWISGPFIYICTGGLLADTDTSSDRPLFLTANHCLSRGKDAKNLETFFQFTTNCNGSCPQPFQDPPGVTKVLGATILSTSSSSDYTLMELKQSPPSGTAMMGWTNAPIANSNGASLHRISHPGGAPQAYSEHEVDTSAGTCQGVPRGDWIYSRDTYGATEGGSSGSPVLNSNGQVVGQLTGSCGYNTGNPCDSVSNATIDGALAAYYSNVSTYLDPDTGGGDPPGGGSCDNDGTCESGEDCTNCGDCEGRTGGRKSLRYCCGDGTAQGPEGDGSICDGNY